MPPVLALLAALILIAGCSADPEPEPRAGEITVSTGSPRGVYFAWASALADQVKDRYPGLAMRVLSSSGSVENLQRLDGGRVSMAISTEDAATQALAGRPPFGTAVPIRAVTRIYDDYVHLVGAADGPVRRLTDLRGRRVATGAAGSGTALVAGRVLGQAGVDVHAVRLDVVDGAQALRRGEVDALFWSGGLPSAVISDLAAQLPIRLIPLDDVAGPLRERFGPQYRATTVPAGTYGLADPVPTLASANLLVCREDTDAGRIRAVLDALFAGRDEIAAAVPAAISLDRRSAVSTGPVPLHPAAVQYFRDSKT